MQGQGNCLAINADCVASVTPHTRYSMAASISLGPSLCIRSRMSSQQKRPEHDSVASGQQHWHQYQVLLPCVLSNGSPARVWHPLVLCQLLFGCQIQMALTGYSIPPSCAHHVHYSCVRNNSFKKHVCCCTQSTIRLSMVMVVEFFLCPKHIKCIIIVMASTAGNKAAFV